MIFQYLTSDSKFGKAMGIADDKLDGMIAAARAEVRPEARAAANMEIQRHIADNAYIMQIYQYPLRWEIWWDRVVGYEPLAANIRSFVRTTSVKE